MDIQIPFVFVSLFSLASVVLIFIYKFGIKEKSYEEALAEQRQQTHILLGIKPKSKENKKNKKTAKKVKEKSALEENHKVVGDEPEQIVSNQKASEIHKKLHVEFKEAPEDVTEKITVNRKQAKKDKVRPILIRKDTAENDSSKVANVDSATPANHFEELHPKDDFELFRSVSAEDTSKDNSEKNISKTDVESQKLFQQKKQSEPDAVPVHKENNLPIVMSSSVNGFVGNSGKEKKKKKSELNTLKQLGDSNGPNMSLLLDLVRKAELSRSEVQILIDLLLNKQHEAPAILDEWSEGKFDPVQKLKKQLAEKEKLLAEEQQIVASAQAKLREIRSEHQNEKTLLQHKVRTMEETLNKHQLESTRLLQQVQQFQAQIKEEVIKHHKLREEYAALQIQRQQFEMRLGQAQESEVIINQLQNDMQEMSSTNNQLRIELTQFAQENIAEKERNQSLILQLTSFQKELEQKNERNRQLEETILKREREIESLLKQENDFKSEISRMNSVIQQQNEEIRRQEHNKKQYIDDLQQHKDESNKLINQLQNDLRQLQEENVQMKVTHINGSLQENKQHEVELLNLHNELSSVKIQLAQVETKREMELKAANSVSEKLQQEVEQFQRKYQEEKSKLEEQKLKNNELRTKNWKVMEALSAAESRIKSNTASVQNKSEKEVQREFVQRLFPEINDVEIMNAEVFEREGEKFIRKYIDSLRQNDLKEDNASEVQLKLQLQHYKNVIDNAEKMLNKLQKHIEQEEINWRMQLSAKTAELESLKESYGGEFQEKMAQLEVELKKEQEDKKRILAQLQKCKNVEDGLPAQHNSSNGVH